MAKEELENNSFSETAYDNGMGRSSFIKTAGIAGLGALFIPNAVANALETAESVPPESPATLDEQFKKFKKDLFVTSITDTTIKHTEDVKGKFEELSTRAVDELLRQATIAKYAAQASGNRLRNRLKRQLRKELNELSTNIDLTTKDGLKKVEDAVGTIFAQVDTDDRNILLSASPKLNLVSNIARGSEKIEMQDLEVLDQTITTVRAKVHKILDSKNILKDVLNETDIRGHISSWADKAEKIADGKIQDLIENDIPSTIQYTTQEIYGAFETARENLDDILIIPKTVSTEVLDGFQTQLEENIKPFTDKMNEVTDRLNDAKAIATELQKQIDNEEFNWDKGMQLSARLLERYVDTEVSDTIQTAYQTYETVNNLLNRMNAGQLGMAAMGGGYVQAAMTLGNAFGVKSLSGGGQSDPKVMAELGQIKAMLKSIQKSIKQLSKTMTARFNKSEQNQERIMDMISDLSEQMTKYHKRTISDINEVKRSVARLAVVAVEINKNLYTTTRDLFGSQMDDANLIKWKKREADLSDTQRKKVIESNENFWKQATQASSALNNAAFVGSGVHFSMWRAGKKEDAELVVKALAPGVFAPRINEIQIDASQRIEVDNTPLGVGRAVGTIPAIMHRITGTTSASIFNPLEWQKPSFFLLRSLHRFPKIMEEEVVPLTPTLKALKARAIRINETLDNFATPENAEALKGLYNIALEALVKEAVTTAYTDQITAMWKKNKMSPKPQIYPFDNVHLDKSNAALVKRAIKEAKHENGEPLRTALNKKSNFQDFRNIGVTHEKLKVLKIIPERSYKLSGTKGTVKEIKRFKEKRLGAYNNDTSRRLFSQKSKIEFSKTSQTEVIKNNKRGEPDGVKETHDGYWVTIGQKRYLDYNPLQVARQFGLLTITSSKKDDRKNNKGRQYKKLKGSPGLKIRKAFKDIKFHTGTDSIYAGRIVTEAFHYGRPYKPNKTKGKNDPVILIDNHYVSVSAAALRAGMKEPRIRNMQQFMDRLHEDLHRIHAKARDNIAANSIKKFKISPLRHEFMAVASSLHYMAAVRALLNGTSPEQATTIARERGWFPTSPEFLGSMVNDILSTVELDANGNPKLDKHDNEIPRKIKTPTRADNVPQILQDYLINELVKLGSELVNAFVDANFALPKPDQCTGLRGINEVLDQIDTLETMHGIKL